MKKDIFLKKKPSGIVFNITNSSPPNVFKSSDNIPFPFKDKSLIPSDNVRYKVAESFYEVHSWINNNMDDIKNNLTQIEFPLLKRIYLYFIEKGSPLQAEEVFSYYSKDYPSKLKESEELLKIKNTNDEGFKKLNQNKTEIILPKEILDSFLHFLKFHNLIEILEIINLKFTFKVEDNLINENNTLNNLDFSKEEIQKINSIPIFYQKLRRKMKFNKDLKEDLIPIPKRYFHINNSNKNSLEINKNNPPTIGCFTLLHSYNKVNCVDISKNGELIACGYNNGTVEVWIADKGLETEINEEKFKRPLNPLKNIFLEGLNKHSEEDSDHSNTDSTGDFAFDSISNRHKNFLFYGHSDAVYSVSIESTLINLISGSYDGDIRLWNIFTKTCLCVFKGHYSPILSVKFSPLSYYFVSGSSDRTARLWSINSPENLRIFIGHKTDVESVDFHPNGLYVLTSANDKTIRLWKIKTGKCCRIFLNLSQLSFIDCMSFSNNGRFLILGVDKGIFIYDILKGEEPLTFIKDVTKRNLISIKTDNKDNIIVVTTSDYQVLFYGMNGILNDEENIKKEENIKAELLFKYTTKKTTIMDIKFTESNIMLMTGRIDDNDPKLFV